MLGGEGCLDPGVCGLLPEAPVAWVLHPGHGHPQALRGRPVEHFAQWRSQKAGSGPASLGRALEQALLPTRRGRAPPASWLGLGAQSLTAWALKR